MIGQAQNGGEKPRNGVNGAVPTKNAAEKNGELKVNETHDDGASAPSDVPGSPPRNGSKRPASSLDAASDGTGPSIDGQASLNGVTPTKRVATNKKSSPFQEQPTPLKSNARQKQFRRTPSSKQTIPTVSASPPSAQEAVASAARAKAGNLRHSWDSLRLGSSDAVGTGAYNALLRDVLRDNGGGSVPQFTPFQTLQIVQTLRPPTVLPPKNSGLEHVLDNFPHNYRYGSDDVELSGMDGDKTEQNYQNSEDKEGERRFMLALTRAYQTMHDQDADTGAAYRQHLQYTMSAESLPQELRRLDDTIVQLNEREKNIMKTTESLGLNSAKVKRDVSYFLGFDGKSTSTSRDGHEQT